MELILFTAICGVANVPWIILPGHYWNDAAFGACAGSCGMQIVLAAMNSRRAKPSSPSSQPMSGTSPSPNPSSSLSQIGSRSLTVRVSQSGSQPSPSENPSKFQPEKRSVPVVGFRAWQAYDQFKLGVGPAGEIGAINAAYGSWHPGVNVATCNAGIYDHAVFTTSVYGGSRPTLPAHSAPDVACACGFYVLTDLDKVPYRWSNFVAVESGVVGAVVGWGCVVQHGDEGWRAEKVQVIAFLDCKISAEHLALTERMAGVYGVPVVSRKALELLAAEYGERLP